MFTHPGMFPQNDNDFLSQSFAKIITSMVNLPHNGGDVYSSKLDNSTQG